MAEKLPSSWEEIQDQLPDSYKWDIEFITNHLGGAAKNGCWSCTPLLDSEPKQIPLTIAHAPVVIPVEHRWPPVGGVKPPPDPRTSSLINPWAELPMDVIRDLFLTFEGALGFYVLISGLLQVIVPDTFDTSWASSHLPHSFGGLKVCYIMNTMEPTTLQSNVAVAHGSSATSQTPNVQITHPSRQSRPAQSLQINDLIEARVSFIPRTKFEGRIGLKVAKNGQLDQTYLVMSTHVITEAILSKTLISRTRNRIRRLQDDWNEHVEICAGGSKIGIIEKSFDQAAEYYPSGFKHDVTLIKPDRDREASIANIQTPVDGLGWLSREAWSSLRQHSAAVKILGPTGPDKQAKCIKCHTNSEATIVGEGVFRNQTASAGSKAPESHDESFWRKFVSRAVLYRVSPDFDIPNGYSGVALWADGKREDGSQGPGIVGFQSFVQGSGHTQNFDLPEGPHLEERLRKGFVAFYGAFQVPDELRQEYSIL
ncbi:hypothetical protein COCMIDRAFT_33704 [Bipolaris oryzae ATCC 44560]|uniref:Uncharacterized protein n=1 Tax=Bipolaris oryzae ATCC 44560 TaxID=930090 RepID=W6ZG29_COCMI|nr:uncharacterized protein COCMIDRAFT_33704 [Bipolaris oryzae ATCC 44560]EUC48838.1 hypothetical protein COCMIDRAFT_33704 [Bipolaris oryzae ATCC 44560]